MGVAKNVSLPDIIFRNKSIQTMSKLAPSVTRDATGGGDADVSLARQLERQELIAGLTARLENEVEMERDMKARIQNITAPTTRAGYLVVAIIGLLLFWFLSRVVFAGSRVATGLLIAGTALFFLYMLKTTLETKGARYIASTSGVALGVV